MSRLMITSDLHLGHQNICKYRHKFSTPEEHHETLFENLATTIQKRDTLYLLGDIAFTKEWLERVAGIKCRYKLLVCGNHDLERGIKMLDVCRAYDDVKALFSKRNYWFSHCPIHPQEIRGRKGNIHGHLHDKLVEVQKYTLGTLVPHPSYFNACVEHTEYKPIPFDALVQEQHNGG